MPDFVSISPQADFILVGTSSAWVDTGLDVTNGQVIKNQYIDGTIRFANGGQYIVPYGIESDYGHTDAPSSHVTYNSPVFVINSLGIGPPIAIQNTGFTYDMPANEPTYRIANATGRIWAAVNDNQYLDNDGQWSFSMSVGYYDDGTYPPADQYTTNKYRDEVLLDEPYVYYPFEHGHSAREFIRRRHFVSGGWDDTTQSDMPISMRIWNDQAALFEFNTDGAFTAANSIRTWPEDGDISFDCLIRPVRCSGRETIASFSYIEVGGHSTGGWELYLQDGRPTIKTGNNDGYDEAVLPESLSASVWYHICFVYNDLSLKIYVNGDEKISISSTNIFDTTEISDTNRCLSVGASSIVASRNPFRGSIDECAYYNSSLTQERVLAHARASGVLNMSYGFERASVYEDVLWRPETTPGSGTGQLFRLMNTNFTIKPETMVRLFRKENAKYNTSSSNGKEHMTGSINGDLAYNDLLFLYRGEFGKGTAVGAPNNGEYAVTVGAASAGTFRITIGGQQTAPIQWNANAAAVQTAIGNLSTVGVELVTVTKPTGNTWIVKLLGHIPFYHTLTAAGIDLTGGAASASSAAGGTAAYRWSIAPSTWAIDDTQTFQIQKGVQGVANAGAKSDKVNITGLTTTFTPSEATISGDFFGDFYTDPFTVDTTDIIELPAVPIDMNAVSVYIGKNLFGTDGPKLMKRLYSFTAGITGKQNPHKTVNSNDPGTSGRGGVEVAPSADISFIVQHDEDGQNLLDNLRKGDLMHIVLVANGDDINADFNFQYVAAYAIKINSIDLTDNDGVFSSSYSTTLTHSTQLGGAHKYWFTTDYADFNG